MDYFSLEKLELYLPVCELLQVRSGILLVSEGVKNSCLFNQIAVTEDKYNLMDVLPFLEEMGGDISLYNDESSLLKREFELELKYLNALVNSSVSTTSFDVNETERLKILLKELGLSWKIKEPFNFSYLPGVVERRRNIYVARDEETVQKLSLAHGDDYLFGRLLGYPPSAVDAYVNKNFYETTFISFFNWFRFSNNNYLEERKLVDLWEKTVSDKSPDLKSKIDFFMKLNE